MFFINAKVRPDRILDWGPTNGPHFGLKKGSHSFLCTALLTQIMKLS